MDLYGEFRVATHAVAVALDVDDVAPVQQAVEQRDSLGRSRIDQRFLPPGGKHMPPYGCHPFQKGGVTSKGDMLLTSNAFLSEGGALAIVVWDFPETPHWTRDKTDFPRPLRKSEARLRLACPPLARRAGAPHEQGAGGESDPLFRRWCATGEGKGGQGSGHVCLPLFGGRSHHRDPWRNSSFIDVTSCIKRPYGFPDDDPPPIMSPEKKQIPLALRGPIGTVGPTELQPQDR